MARRRVSSPDQRRFGAHMSIAGGLHEAFARAETAGCDCLQVFVKNQRQWQAPPLKLDDVARWHELLATPGFGPAVAHATYLINLASGDDALHEKSRRAFTEELGRCQTLGIPYLVIHPGAAGEQTPEQAIERVAAALDLIFAEQPGLKTMPLLETTAGQGTALGRDFCQIGAIIDRLSEPQRVGVCVDTCHVFAAGYDIRDPEAYEAMIDEAKKAVGLKRIRCWHFNDSRGECGGHLDRHAHIGHGRIGNVGFRHILADSRFHGVPMIIETPKGEDANGREWDRVNIRRLRAIAARATKTNPRPKRRRGQSEP